MKGLWFVKVEILKGGKEDAWRAGYNAQNNGWRIRIFRDIDNFAGVFAQELYELRWKWLWLQVPARFPCVLRRMELASHAIESLIAAEYYGYDLETYLAKEAHTMRNYAWLKHMTDEQRIAGMKKYFGVAKRWIKRNRETIDDAFNT